MDGFCNKRENDVTVLHLNISMHKHFDAFNTLSLTRNLSDSSTVIGVTEAWFLSESDVNYVLFMDIYSLVSSQKRDKIGGGVDRKLQSL